MGIKCLASRGLEPGSQTFITGSPSGGSLWIGIRVTGLGHFHVANVLKKIRKRSGGGFFGCR